MSNEIMIFMQYLILGFLGASFGSFAGVIISRFPQGQSIVWPRSYCDACKEKLHIWHNIPIVSWLLLRGKCYFCRRAIHPRSFMIELILAVCAIGLYLKFGLDFALVERFLFVFLLICLAYIDLDTFFLPYSLLLALFIVGILSTVWYGFYPAHYMGIGKPFFWLDFMVLPTSDVLWDRIGGALLGAFVLIAINLVATYFFRRSKRLHSDQWAMGFGDAILIFAIGLFVGASHLILVLFLASATGSIFGILHRFFPILSDPVDEDIVLGALPFGPFLALAAIYVYLL